MARRYLSIIASVLVLAVPVGSIKARETASAADTTFYGLHISKTDNLPSWWRVYPGDSVAFTLPIDNEANEYAVHNVVVTDALPGEMEFVSASEGGVYNPDTRRVLWEIGTLAPGEGGEVHVVLVVREDAPLNRDLHNCAYARSDETGVQGGACSVTRTYDGTIYPLNLEKQAQSAGECFSAPGEIDYTLNYYNPNFTDLHNVVLVDSLLGSAEFVSASAGGVYSPETRKVTWSLGTVSKQTGGDAGLVVCIDSGLPSGSQISNYSRISCDEALPRVATAFVPVCAAQGNPGVKVAIHLEEHLPARSCAGDFPSIATCADIVTTIDAGDVDAFPVFFNLNEYLGLEYGLMWPGQYSCAFTSCSDLTIGGISDPGDGVAHAWHFCQPGPIAVPGWAWIYEEDAAHICIVEHPWAYAISVLDCSPEGRLDHPDSSFCAGIAGAEGGDPCDHPTNVERATWGGIKSMFR